MLNWLLKVIVKLYIGINIFTPPQWSVLRICTHPCRAKVPITHRSRDYAPDMEKYQAVQFFLV